MGESASLKPLDAIVDAGAAPEEMAAVESVFRAANVPATVRDDYVRLSAEVLPFVVMFIAPVTWVAAKFAGGFAAKAREDAWDEYRSGGWRGLSRFITEIAAARQGRAGRTTIRDPTGPDLDLAYGIPDEALQELAELDWDVMRNGDLGWDPVTGQWLFLHATRAPRGLPPPRRH
jgi:hypothetical protein